jgi:hypothetical protein
MRKLDWLLAAVIGIFLAGALAAQAMDLVGAGFGAAEPRDIRPGFMERLVSVGADQVIARHCPVMFRHP